MKTVLNVCLGIVLAVMGILLVAVLVTGSIVVKELIVINLFNQKLPSLTAVVDNGCKK